MAQRGEVTSPETHSWSMSEPRFELKEVQSAQTFHLIRRPLSPEEKAVPPPLSKGAGQHRPMGRASREVSQGLAGEVMTSPGQNHPCCCSVGSCSGCWWSLHAPGSGLRCWMVVGLTVKNPKPVPGSAAGDAWHLGAGLGERPSTGA